MILKKIKSKGLAHSSYFLADENEAVVVDPRRDCIIYKKLADQECVEIRYILETHRNEDYVIGSVELKNITGAEIAHSKELLFKYGDHNLANGDTLTVGSLKIKALYTPGHTDDSICYVVYQPPSEDPMIVFTGDTLFVGAVGRTDLYGAEKHREQAGKLYDSIHDKLIPLGDHVIFYPAHGGGSVCGHGISDREFSTIGYEQKTNPLLQLERKEFVKRSIDQKMLVPPYFRRMEQYNLDGPPLSRELPVPKSLNVSEFKKEMESSDTVVVDTREPDAFASSFIPHSLNIWLDGVSIFPGWVINDRQRILLVTERKNDVEIAKTYLWRIGFHNIEGYLCPGMNSWRVAGSTMDHLSTLSATMLKRKLDRDEVVLLDVREPSEWKEGYIEESERIYVGHLKDETDKLSRDKPVASTCSVGYRGSIGASILKRSGFKEVYTVLGGIKAWKNLGYPLKRE
ncbi:MAG: MBL fold metallo-hydrolase [Thermoproteota archaeon]